MATGIHWTDETINPIVGCSKISSGCLNCYAQKMAVRLAHMGLGQYQSVLDGWTEHGDEVMKYGGWNGATAVVFSELQKPSKWKKPKSIFVGSMGDVFHETVDDEDLNSIMEMTMCCPQHTFIFLTKRAHRMCEYFRDFPYGLQNVVLGVSVEDQATANERIPLLLNTPAAKRFISLEPMLESVDLERGGWSFLRSLRPPPGNKNGWDSGLDGVILGGESGTKARLLNPEWVRLVRDQCAAVGVPFMFKQNSAFNKPFMDKHWGMDTECQETGFPFLDGRTHTELAWRVQK